MILKNLSIFLQNVCKNKLFTDSILETKKNFNIFLIQELSWNVIYSIPSFTSEEGDKVVGASDYPNWFIFSKSPTNDHDYPKVITYINTRLIHLSFSLRKDILTIETSTTFCSLIIVLFSS